MGSGGRQVMRPVDPPRDELLCEHNRQLIRCPFCAVFEDGAAEAIIERAEFRWVAGERWQ
jgi:hypothetical protein